MAQPYVRTLSAVAISNACPLDHFSMPFHVGIAVAITTGPATYSVEFTLDDPKNASDAQGTGLVWFTHATLAAQTANATGNFAFPVRAARLNVTALTAGSVTMTVIQAGGGPR